LSQGAELPHKIVHRLNAVVTYYGNILYFINLRLNHWSDMDYFNDVFSTFLGLKSSSCIGCQWRDGKLSDIIHKIFIGVLKMNKSLTGLERHVRV